MGHFSFCSFFLGIGFLSVELQPTPHKRKQHEHHTLNTQHTTPHLPLLLFLLFFLPTLPLHSLQHTRTDTRTHAHRTTPLPQTTRTKHPHAHNTPCAPHFALHFSFLYFFVFRFYNTLKRR